MERQCCMAMVMYIMAANRPSSARSHFLGVRRNWATASHRAIINQEAVAFLWRLK